MTARFKALRFSQRMGWAELIIGTGYAALGVVLLITSHHAGGLALGIVSVINAWVFIFAGAIRALRAPKQIRRNAEKVLQLSQDAG
jgi:hypothetical protein